MEINEKTICSSPGTLQLLFNLFLPRTRECSISEAKNYTYTEYEFDTENPYLKFSDNQYWFRTFSEKF